MAEMKSQVKFVTPLDTHLRFNGILRHGQFFTAKGVPQCLMAGVAKGFSSFAFQAKTHRYNGRTVRSHFTFGCENTEVVRTPNRSKTKVVLIIKQ
jgi:hypothetical protein